MPIIGLTDRRRLPRLGKIYLGVKAVNAAGKEYPKAVDYFVCPPEVQQVYGEKPRELDIIFPLEDENVFASTYYRAYTQTRGLVCKGDGVTANRLIDVASRRTEPETGIITGDIPTAKAREVEWVEEITCPGEQCPYYQARQCKQLMVLQFLMPRVPGLGIWQLDTSSINSIVNIHSGIALIRAIFGQVQGIPLVLALEPLEVAPEGQRKTVWVLQLRSRSTLNQLAQARQQPYYAVLPAPADQEVPELLYPDLPQEPSTGAVTAPLPAAAAPASPEEPAEAPSPGPARATPRQFNNVGELLTAALDELGLDRRAVLDVFVVGRVEDIPKPYSQAWEKLKAIHQP